MAARLIQRASRLLAVPPSFQALPTPAPSECMRFAQLAPSLPCRAALYTSPLCRLPDSLPDSLPEVSQSPRLEEDEEFSMMLRELPGVEELLEISREQKVTGNRAVMVIQQIAMKDTRNNEKIRNDPRFHELLENVNKKIQFVWNTRLTNLLKSLYRLGLHRNDHYLKSVEIEVRWRLRRLTMGNLGHLANSLPYASRKDEKSLLGDLLKEVELRWTEIRDTRTLVSLITRLGPMSGSLMEKLEDKALEFAEQLTPEESRRIVSSLAEHNRRTLSILRALSFHLLQNKSELTPSVIIDLTVAFAKLNFCNPEVLQKMATDILPKLPELKPADIAHIVRSIASLRFPNQVLCEAIAKVCLERQEMFNTTHLCYILQGFAFLNFHPSHSEEFFSMIHERLSDADTLPWQLSLEAVWSLCVLSRVTEPDFQRVLVPQFYNKVLEDDSAKSTGYCVKLMNVNAAAQLGSLRYQGEPLPNDVLRQLRHKTPTKVPKALQIKVQEGLKAVFPEEGTCYYNVATVYGFYIDGELILDSEMKALPLKDFAAPHNLQSGGTQPLPEGARRVAILSREFSHFMFRGKDLQGQHVMNRRHLQAAGFLVVEVPYYDWQEIKSEWQKLYFLREQIKKAVAEETAQ